MEVDMFEVRLMQMVSLKLEEHGNIHLQRTYNLGSKDVTIDLRIEIDDNEYVKKMNQAKP